jgi:hypothetical protein
LTDVTHYSYEPPAFVMILRITWVYSNPTLDIPRDIPSSNVVQPVASSPKTLKPGTVCRPTFWMVCCAGSPQFHGRNGNLGWVCNPQPSPRIRGIAPSVSEMTECAWLATVDAIVDTKMTECAQLQPLTPFCSNCSLKPWSDMDSPTNYKSLLAGTDTLRPFHRRP